MKHIFFISAVLLSSPVWASKTFPEFPYSKDMDVLIVADDMNYNGIQMRVLQFKTKADEDDVADFYKSQWGDEMTDVVFGDWRILSHREGDFLMTVQIEQNTPSPTHGTLGISPMFAIVEGGEKSVKNMKKDIGEGFPTPPTSVFINDIRSNDGGINTRTLIFENTKSVRQNVQFYLKKMQSDGWDILGGVPENISEINTLAMNRGTQKINLSFVRDDRKTFGVAVTLN